MATDSPTLEEVSGYRYDLLLRPDVSEPVGNANGAEEVTLIPGTVFPDPPTAWIGPSAPELTPAVVVPRGDPSAVIFRITVHGPAEGGQREQAPRVMALDIPRETIGTIRLPPDFDTMPCRMPDVYVPPDDGEDVGP